MKTKAYNPSQLEVELSTALTELKGEIEKYLTDNKVVEIENRDHQDNPMLIFHLEDKDGDKHEMVVKVIQRADEE